MDNSLSTKWNQRKVHSHRVKTANTENFQTVTQHSHTDLGSHTSSSGGAISPTSNSAGGGGINPYLISVCIEYLQQPVALREEGLFRVPGDSSLMKALHKDFQSRSGRKEQLRSGFVTMAIHHSVNSFCNRGNALNKQLSLVIPMIGKGVFHKFVPSYFWLSQLSGYRAAVMEQKDPNTVSGLLKLHLRENGLLSQQSLNQLLPHVEARDHVCCSCTVGSPNKGHLGFCPL